MTEIQPLPDDEKDDVVFKIRGTVGMIQLNRPKKLNSLNGSMIRKIIPVLKVNWPPNMSLFAPVNVYHSDGKRLI